MTSTSGPARPVTTLAAVLATALVLGLALGLLKGTSPGLRAGLGNLSAPWVLVGLAPGLLLRRPVASTVAGLAATLVALLGFYAVQALLLGPHLRGDGAAGDLQVELVANRVYLVLGAVTGTLGGFAGGLLGRRSAGRRGEHARDLLGIAVVLAGGLLAAEIAVVATVAGHRLLPPPLYFAWAVADWRPYLLEAATGVLLLGLGLRVRRTSTG